MANKNRKERKLEKDRINMRRDREENAEKYKAMRQIDIYRKACGLLKSIYCGYTKHS